MYTADDASAVFKANAWSIHAINGLRTWYHAYHVFHIVDDQSGRLLRDMRNAGVTIESLDRLAFNAKHSWDLKSLQSPVPLA